jgi:hypothetical protein
MLSENGSALSSYWLLLFGELLLLPSLRNFLVRRYTFCRFDLVQLRLLTTVLLKNLQTVLDQQRKNRLYCQY